MLHRASQVVSAALLLLLLALQIALAQTSSPILSATISPANLGAAGGNVTIFAKGASGNGASFSAIITLPDGATTTRQMGLQSYNSDGSVTYGTSYNVPANATSSVLTYRFAVTTTTNKVWTVNAGATLALPANANRVVSGVLTFEGISQTAAAQNVVFEFRPADGTPIFTLSGTVGVNGAFTLNNIPQKVYALHIKSDKYLSSNASLDATGGDVSNVNAILPTGDVNNDNFCDSTDFGLLIGAFGSSAALPRSGYIAGADLNSDGFVDSTDFGLLIGSFNAAGDL